MDFFGQQLADPKMKPGGGLGVVPHGIGVVPQGVGVVPHGLGVVPHGVGVVAHGGGWMWLHDAGMSAPFLGKP